MEIPHRPARAAASWRCISPSPTPEGGSERAEARSEEVTWGDGYSKAELWPPHLGFVPLFCSQLLLFPEWRRLGGSTAQRRCQ